MADATDRTSILIVDDSPEKIVALESILDELGQDIVKAASGREALRHLLTRDFAVILLDVRMPVMDGFETAALIRERPRSEHTPIIFVTAFPDETHVARGYSLKAVDYIFTPVVPDVLRTKVAVFADLHRMTAQVKRQAESLRQRAAQLHRLSTASLEINGAQSLDDMVKVVADSAREILGVPRAVATARVHDRRIHLATSPAALAAPLDGAEDDLVTSIVRSTNQPYRTPSGSPPAGRFATDSESFLAVPLTRRDGRNIGELRVSGKPHGAFTQEDEDILVQLAQMTSIAVENTLYGELREANRLKDEFLATVSHELRTPLSAMLSWVWMLRRGGLDAEGAARAIEAIERNVKAQTRIVEDLLDVSRIVTGKLRLDTRLVDLGPIIEMTTDSITPAAEAKGITVRISIDGATPPVLGDAIRLQQLVWNLLTNAIKFTSAGGRVDVVLATSGAEVEVRVSDTGIGISQDFLAYVFEPFRQADGSSGRKSGGLGLGLAIVRHVAELHGGRVEARSAGEDQGSTFVLTLPVATGREAIEELTPSPPSAETAAPRTAVSLAGSSVLVVEDEADTREALVLILAQAGATVTSTSTAAQALDAVAAARPDILLCDIGLPTEDGYVLIRKLRALTAEQGGATPAVALSAFAQATDRARAIAAGFDTHVAKPIDPDRLLQTLARALSLAVGDADPGDPYQPALASEAGS